MNPFSYRPNNNEDKVIEDQKPLVLRMYDTGSFNWVRLNMEYIFAMIESSSRQIFPRMNWNDNSGVTRANVQQTSLALDSGAPIHFFSNQEEQQFDDNSLWWINIQSSYDRALA